jgi:hypothetical protein
MHIHKVIRLFSPRRAAASYVYSVVVTTPPSSFSLLSLVILIGD